MPSSPGFPEPSPDELAHSARLLALIREEIAAAGPMDFARYMALALYAPGLGYYSAGRTRFGAAGDFVTAPELGGLFARCVARALAPVLGPGRVLLELGAGSGAFAVAALAELERLDALPDAYAILDTSADLRERQCERIARELPHLLDRVAWLDRPPAAPWRGALFANEVVDALPVRLFEWRDGALHARVVVDDGAGLAFDRAPADADLAAAVARAVGDPAGLPSPYRSEVLPQLDAWFAAVAEQLVEGVALCVDYGYPRHEYYHPQRREGTLIAHYRHRAHEAVLTLPGLSDLTSFVDFTALAEAMHHAGFEPACYASQAQFLLAAGLPEIAAVEAERSAADQLRLTAEIRRLTLPGEMGERFKVLAGLRGVDRARLPWLAVDQGRRL
jgi:SAM-dependent MidA family methyltransferase